MTQGQLEKAAQKRQPPWSHPVSPEQRLDNRRWWLLRAEAKGTLEDTEIEALRQSAETRYLTETEEDGGAQRRVQQYLNRIRKQSGR